MEKKVEVRTVLNRGRDIAPFLVEFKNIYSKYDFVCWVHGKKSLHTPGYYDWRKYLLDNLLGSRKIVKIILGYFLKNLNLGILYPQIYPKIAKYKEKNPWRDNWKKCLCLGKKLGLNLNKNKRLEYSYGSMFWFRPKAFEPLFSLGLSFNDFEAGVGKIDGTFVHAIERLITLVAQKQGCTFKKVLFYSK